MARILGGRLAMIAHCSPGRPIFVGGCVSEGVGRNVWRIVSPFTFVSSEGYVIEIPAGFLTDFASVPRVLWPIVPCTDGQYDAAAVVHDYAVRWRKVLGISLNDCHHLFYEAMQARDVAGWRAWAMFRAVWLFNWTCAGPGDGTTPPELIRRTVVRLRTAD